MKKIMLIAMATLMLVSCKKDSIDKKGSSENSDGPNERIGNIDFQII